jgi:hypothetical protein
MKTIKKEIPVNQITVSTYYNVNKDGSITYDFEQIKDDFKSKLSSIKFWNKRHKITIKH